jgi:flavin-binding protein dodecin
MATQMTYSIFARDGTSRIVLKRESREAAERKARELTDLGWFEVRIDDEVPIEEAEKKQLRVT